MAGSPATLAGGLGPSLGSAPSASLALVSVPFRGGHLLAAQLEGEVWVPLLPVCEALGVSPQGQLAKLRAKPWATIKIILSVAGDGKARQLAAVDLRSLPLWLATIEPSRVKPEAREALVAYQREAADALYRHFLAPPTDPGGPSWAQLAADVASLRDEVRQLAHGRRRLSDHDAARAQAFCEGRTDVTPLEVMTAGLGWELPDEIEIRAIERLLKTLGFVSTWRRPRFVRCNETARWTRVAALPQRCA